MKVMILDRRRLGPLGAPPAGGASIEGRIRRNRLDSSGNLAAEFLRVCRSCADKTAVVEGAQSFSYRWLCDAALNVRRELMTRPRLDPGSPVGLMLGNSPEYIAALFGVLLAGAVAVPLPATIEPERWRQIRESCEFSLLITRREDWATRKDLHAEMRGSVVPARDEQPAELPIEAVGRGGDDLAMIAYTSGSTGLPKGVMLSHRNLLANAQSILDYLPIRGDDRALVILPFCLAFGNSILQTHLLSGATLVLGGSLTFPGSILEALRQQRATSFSAVPELYAMLLRFAALGDQPLPDLRYMAAAGGALEPDLADRVAQRIRPARLYVMYGQTEATARLSYLPPEQLQSHRGSIGRGIPGVQLRVADADGNPVAPGQSGRLLARGENIMLGYWRDPEATAAVLQDGWLDTGDLGTVDADGYIYLQGRSNLLLKIQGRRIHPREIEDRIVEHFPGSQAVVVPYGGAGETRLALFLTPPAGMAVTEASVRQVCRKSLPRYKMPAHVELIERLPLNDAMKVDRGVLAERPGQRLRRVS